MPASVMDQSAANLGNVAPLLADASGVLGESASRTATAGRMYEKAGARGNIARSMNSYLNPYQQQVIAQTQGRMRDQTEYDLDAVSAQAQNAGAFGGSRHGLVESQVRDNAARNMAEMTNSMNMQGFNTAAGLGAQDVQNQFMGAGGLANAAGQLQGVAGGLGNIASQYGSLAGQQFGLGQNIMQNQMNTGNMQQMMNQQILSGAGGQFGQTMNYPMQMLNQQLAALSGNPLGGESTTTTTPGLFDYLGLAAGVGSSWLNRK